MTAQLVTRKAMPVRTIGLLLGGAAALVGLNRPSVGSVTPTVALVAAAVVLTVLSAPRRDRGITPLESVLAATLVVQIVVEFAATELSRTPFGKGMVLDAVLVLAVLYVVRTVRNPITLAWCVVVPAAGVAALALAQVADIPGVNSVLVQLMRGSGLQARLDNGWEVRATSTIGHWTALGGYLCVAVAIGCALLIHLSHTNRPGSRLLTVIIAVMAGGQVATFTFATIGATAAVLLATVVVLRPRPAAVVGALVACAGLWFAFSGVFLQRIAKQQSNSIYASGNSVIPESVRFRMTVWERETIPAALDNLVTGHGSLVYNYVGTGLSPRPLVWPSPESEWLRTLVSSGALVLILELVALGMALSILISTARLDSAFVPLAVMGVAMTVVMFIHSHLHDRAFSILFWATAVAALTIRRSIDAAHEETP